MVADKMVWTKLYGQNGIWTLDKMVSIGENGTDKMVRIKKII